VLDAVARLVLHVGDGKIGRGIAPRPALDCHHIKAGIGQLIGEN